MPGWVSPARVWRWEAALQTSTGVEATRNYSDTVRVTRFVGEMKGEGVGCGVHSSSRKRVDATDDGAMLAAPLNHSFRVRILAVAASAASEHES